MKKFLILLITLLSLFGCANKANSVDTKRIAILKNDSEDLILFLDNDDDILAEKKIEQSEYFYYQDSILYYSSDGSAYSGININTLEDSKGLKNVVGSLLVYQDDDSFITYQNGQAYTVDYFGVQTPLEGYLCFYCYDSKNFYMLDYSNFLYIYSREDYSLIKKERISGSNYLNFVVINDQVYLVNDNGYTSISEEDSNYTYIYPNDFNEIDNSYGDLLFVHENKEQAIYRVSFDNNKMVLTDVYDEIYYREIVYSQEFKDYYDQGYEVIWYQEIY